MPRSGAFGQPSSGRNKELPFLDSAREGVWRSAPPSEAFQCLDKCPEPGLDAPTVLTYRLVAGPVDLAPLQIRQTRRFGWQGVTVTAHVLGASHAVTLDLPDGPRVTELLTCLPPEPGGDTDAVLCLPTPIRDTGRVAGDASVDGVLAVSTHLCGFPLENGDGLLGAFDDGDTLHEPFPAPHGSAPAWTRVGWAAEGATLRVETIHTYPEAGCGVRSETRFTLSPSFHEVRE